jgi:hypothetical protein
MKIVSRLLTPSVAFLAASIANAQSGTLDQVSPWAPGGQSAWFNGDASFLIWQQQVRSGLAGTLEGYRLRLDGPAGAQLDVRLRNGDGWSTNGVLHQVRLTKTIAGHEDFFVDVTSAAYGVAVGGTFVIELQGNDTGCGIIGSYVDPALGPPLYPEPLFLNAPPCFSNCGWRIGFETFVLSGATAYCTAGTTTSGCVPAMSGIGAASGSAGSGFTIQASNVEGQKQGILFYGVTGPQAAPWGGASTSYICVLAPVQRMFLQNSGGTADACDGVLSADWNAFIAGYPGAVGTPFTGGETVWAQGWFRDPPAPRSTNLTDGLQFSVGP